MLFKWNWKLIMVLFLLINFQTYPHYDYYILILGGSQNDTNLFPNVDSSWKVSKQCSFQFLVVVVISCRLCCIVHLVPDIWYLIFTRAMLLLLMKLMNYLYAIQLWTCKVTIRCNLPTPCAESWTWFL